MTSAHSDPLVGATLDGRYLLRARLARGGMSTVYLALDMRLDREVAVKAMLPHLAEDPALVARFEREAKTAARLAHPHVVGVLDQGHADGPDGDVVAYLVMEYVPGCTLRTVIRDEAPLTTRRALTLLLPVLDGLAAAHTAGLMHRDVKPENVLVGEDGRVRVADFGLSRATTAHSSGGTALVGTVAYLSPELVSGAVADARSDVYAAGILLFELLTGRQPFTGDTPVQVAYEHVRSRVPSPATVLPEVPEQVADLVLWCTEPDPADRPADATEVAAQVRRLLTTVPADRLDRSPQDGPEPEESLENAAVLIAPADSGAQPTSVVPLPASPGSETTAAAAVRASSDQTRVLEHGGLGRLSADQPTGVPDSSPAPLPTPSARQRRRAARRPVLDVGRTTTRTLATGVAVTLLLAGMAILLGWTLGSGNAPFTGASSVMPELGGTDRQTAVARLRESGLQVEVSTRPDEVFSAGAVVASSPAAGTEVRTGDRVELTVSSGPAPVAVPDLLGRELEQARSAAQDAGLLVQVEHRRHDREVPAGRVIAQVPAAADTVARRSVVRLTVSEGPRTVEVPDVTGLTVDQARARAEQAGLRVEVETTPGGGLFGLRQPRILDQQPAAGEELEEGSVFRADAF